MVQIINAKDKSGKNILTKDGEAVVNVKFTAGDEFIPYSNSLIERNAQKDDGTRITVHTLKCIIKDHNNEQPVFVTLTPAQANTIKKKLADGVILSENLFQSYEYSDKDNISRVGIGFKPKPIANKTFSDFN